MCPNCLLPGISREIDRDDKRNEKLSMRKQLKLKCQEQHTVTPGYEKSSFGVEHEHDTTVYQPMPISSYMPAGKNTNTYLISKLLGFELFDIYASSRTFQVKDVYSHMHTFV